MITIITITQCYREVGNGGICLTLTEVTVTMVTTVTTDNNTDNERR